jgi:uncharacterized protein involved in exopolysaccharide biosynthesis
VSTLQKPIALRPPTPAWKKLLRIAVIGSVAFVSTAFGVALLVLWAASR